MTRKKKEQDAENRSNAVAALDSTVAGRRPVRRKAASLRGRWAKHYFLSPGTTTEAKENEKRKRKLPSTPQSTKNRRSVRPRLATTISTGSPTTSIGELRTFFATADPKSKRRMHLNLLQEACKASLTKTVQQAFNEFCKLPPCLECQAKNETPYACRVTLAHDADLGDSLAAILWSRMHQHWQNQQDSTGDVEIWTCQHCGIDILLAQSDQCFVCHRRWKGGLAAVTRKPLGQTRATMSFIAAPKQQQEGSFLPLGKHMDSEKLPSASMDPPNAAKVAGSLGQARKVTEDTSALQQDSPEGLERRPSMGKEDKQSINKDQQPLSVLELDSVIANPETRHTMLMHIYQAAHQNKSCPAVPFRGSDGRLYGDTSLAFDLFSGMDQCPDCQLKQVLSPFQCRIVNGHDEGLNAEALGTKFLIQTRKGHWVDEGEEGWTCSDCMVGLPASQERCFLCSGRKGGTKPNMDDEGIWSLEDLERAMGSDTFTWIPLLMRMIQVATHNKHIPTALFLDSNIALAFDLLSGLDPCAACCKQLGGGAATRSAFDCRIARGHSDDLGDSLESILLNRLKLPPNQFVEYEAQSPDEILEVLPRNKFVADAVDECPSLADTSTRCADPQSCSDNPSVQASTADLQVQSPEKLETQSLEEVLPLSTIEKEAMKLAMEPSEHASKVFSLSHQSNDSPRGLPRSNDSIENRNPLQEQVKAQEQREKDENQPQKSHAKPSTRFSKKVGMQPMLEEPVIESFEELCERMGPGSRPSLFRRILVRIIETAARNRKDPEARFLNMNIQIVFDLFSGLDPCFSCSENGVYSAFTCRIAKQHSENLDGSVEAKILKRMRKGKNWIEDDEPWTCEDCLIPLHSSSRRCFLCSSWKDGRRSLEGTGEDLDKSTPSPGPTEKSPPLTSLSSLASAETCAFVELHHVAVKPGNVKVWECFICSHRNHWKRFACGKCGDTIGGTHMFVAEDSDWSKFELEHQEKVLGGLA